MTRRLADATGIEHGGEVLDIASGCGTTALLMARERAARVVGVDLSAANVALATGAATLAGLTGQIRFEVGDAEQLPVPDASVDMVLCECAMCTFPDKVNAAAEINGVRRAAHRRRPDGDLHRRS
ncbi:class I SAM-dependent methyltransferase [Kribbella qitaiheensis]|uniref:class I SAM-dependent methyltransferase n=1 Tax=Kribbella qitaiheensis TaxID=1544730 RepID=UPI0019D6A41C|nr:class I SAM-dependent methyltransferase [Kribbella qitaiheensis]